MTYLTRRAYSHATHHLLAIYAMGANAQTIKAAYATHRAYQRPAVPPPEPIGKHNWKEHLGDEKYVWLSAYHAI